MSLLIVFIYLYFIVLVESYCFILFCFVVFHIDLSSAVSCNFFRSKAYLKTTDVGQSAEQLENK